MPRDIALFQSGRESLLREGLYRALVNAAANGSCAKGRMLDVGCGRGEVMHALQRAGFQVVGIDAEAACVAASSAYGMVHQGKAEDAEALFRGQDFEALVCSHVLEHLPNPRKALRAMAGVSARKYVFAVPNILRPARIVRALLGRRRGDHPHHLFGWGHAEFERLLSDCGFRVVSWRGDRVTMLPLGGRLGERLGRWLQRLEEGWLLRLLPMLSSSLIVVCIRDPSVKLEVAQDD